MEIPMPKPTQLPLLLVTFPDGSVAAFPVHTEAVGKFSVDLTGPDGVAVGDSAAGRWGRDLLTPAPGVSVHLDF